MSVFEHITTLVSFILSLGIASLATLLATLIQNRNRVAPSIPFFLWMAVIFFIQLSYWLVSFQFRHIRESSLIGLGIVLSTAISAFLACALIIPRGENVAYNLRAQHDNHRSEYIGAVLAFDVLSLVFLLHFTHQSGLPLPLEPLLLVCGCCVGDLIALFVSARAVQIAMPVLLLLLRFSGFPGLIAGLST